MELTPGKQGGVVRKQHVLIVEDDIPLAKFLRRHLESEGYDVTLAHDGLSAKTTLEEIVPNLVILDLNLPGMDGASLLSELRPARPKLPILVLTAKSGVDVRVQILDTGADDYLRKPFSAAELSARLRALLRRNADPVEDRSTVGDLVLDRQKWRVERAGRRIELTSKEFALLDFLMRNARRLVSRAELMENVWGQVFDPSTNLVDVYVKYVRDKVDAGSDLKLIRTIRGLGYMLSDEIPQ